MDNFLLLLFALPIATIIISSVLETIIKNPIAVAAFVFAVFLIVAFAAFDATFLVFVIIYTILAFVSAVITRAIISLIKNDEDSIIDNENNNCNNNNAGCGCTRGYNNRYYR